MSKPTEKLPERRELHHLSQETITENAYARAAYFVGRMTYPTLLVATSIAHQGIPPADSRERYLLSLAIEAIREHERRLRAARTKLAAMRNEGTK